MRFAALLVSVSTLVVLFMIFIFRQEPAALKTLDEILRSKNDNDPRLDTDFNHLSPENKQLFRQKYYALAPEMRNERGTIVYLLGKNLSNVADWEFLRSVVREPPCLSLANCSSLNPSAHESGDQVTLAYPALIALKQVERALLHTQGQDRWSALHVIKSATQSKVPMVAHAATSIYQNAASSM